MKKLFLSVIATVALTNFSNAQNIKDIGRDPLFVEYANESVRMINSIKDASAIQRALEDMELTEQELLTYPSYFGTTSVEELSNAIKAQNKRLEILADRYSFPSIDKGILEAELSEAFGPFVDHIVIVPASAEKRTCKQRLVTCVGAAWSVAVGANYACLSVDATIIGGIVCHGAVMTGYYFALEICGDNYDDCKENEGK
jgi:hypothetical protein